ncbi:MAG: RimK family alpha-L-glutamate ligase [Candidatus Methanomethylicia archaeon]|nr:RimK family alpha-L-glutamate ligase [Candidatus Methanomethylicia archaeon]MCX8168901.1 RimK family alpha-L-glutamate ligase [Candidatus Methanomethylicia archaeon]MDW7988633.1 RimK family alpha-L-glutamate ligase [Nitrososphaerota archaeon]
MIIGIITRNPNSWSSRNIMRAIEEIGCTPFPFKFRDILSFISDKSIQIFAKNINLIRDVSAIIVRPFGRMSLDQAILRIDILYALQEMGIPIINKPSTIEKCVDKFRALYTLKIHGLPVPKTIVTERSNIAIKNLNLLKSPYVVIKPMFGSRGHGSTRIRLRDRDVLWEVIKALSFVGHTIYIQEFLPHGGVDIRAFIIGGKVIAAMYRKGPRGMWKTNIAQGAVPQRINKLEPNIEELAIKATEILECDIAGVDIVVIEDSPYILEVNSQPGWKGLQSVVTDMDIAREIVKYVIEKARK